MVVDELTSFCYRASNVRVKVAEYAARQGDFQKATEAIDETIRRISMDPKSLNIVGSYTTVGALIHLAAKINTNVSANSSTRYPFATSS